MSPSVSVLITSYNREQFLAHAIESVLGSTFEDFELIIVDDGSDDRSIEIAKRFEKKDERTRVYKNQENKGQFENRNYAASLAQGKFIKYVDSDDLIYPHTLEVMVRGMKQFPEAGYGQSRPPEDNQPRPTLISSEDVYREHFLLDTPWKNSPVAAIMRKEAFKKVGGFPLGSAEGDVGLWLKLSARFPVVKLVNELGFWRAHEDQVSVHRRKDIARDTIDRYEISLAALDSKYCPLSENEALEAKELVYHKMAREIVWRIRQRRFRVAYLIYEMSGFSPATFLGALPRPGAFNKQGA